MDRRVFTQHLPSVVFAASFFIVAALAGGELGEAGLRIARGATNGVETMVTGSTARQANHPYVGMWVTADGRIRHNLLPNGRYDEARGTRESAYQGRYRVVGDHIEYVDDTGFTADGDFRDGVLHHGGMVFYRQKG